MYINLYINVWETPFPIEHSHWAHCVLLHSSSCIDYPHTTHCTPHTVHCTPYTTHRTPHRETGCDGTFRPLPSERCPGDRSVRYGRRGREGEAKAERDKYGRECEIGGVGGVATYGADWGGG